jgi:hypothetical protein
LEGLKSGRKKLDGTIYTGKTDAGSDADQPVYKKVWFRVRQGGRRTAGTGAEKQLKGAAESRIWGGNPKKAGFSFLRLPVYHAGKLCGYIDAVTGYFLSV